MRVSFPHSGSPWIRDALGVARLLENRRDDRSVMRPGGEGPLPASCCNCHYPRFLSPSLGFSPPVSPHGCRRVAGDNVCYEPARSTRKPVAVGHGMDRALAIGRARRQLCSGSCWPTCQPLCRPAAPLSGFCLVLLLLPCLSLLCGAAT